MRRPKYWMTMLAMGSGRKAKRVSLGLMASMKTSAPAVKTMVLAEYMMAGPHPDGVQIVGGAGHDVAGAVALVVGVGEALQVLEQVVAQIEFDVAGDADDHPAREELEDAFDEGDGDYEQGIGQEFLAGYTGVKIVDGATQNLREEDPDSVIA